MGNSDGETKLKKKREKGDQDSVHERKEAKDRQKEKLKEKIEREKERLDREKERLDREKERLDRQIERLDRKKERVDGDKEDRKVMKEKEKEERKAWMDREKAEIKARMDKEKAERKERMDKEKEERKTQKGKEKEERNREKEERKKNKEGKGKNGHYDYHHEDEEGKLSPRPSGSEVKVSGGPVQPEETQWYLREPDVEPIHDQRAGPSHPNHSPPPQYSPLPPPHQPPLRTVGDVGGVPPARDVPPSGYRISLGPNVQFPALDQLGVPPAFDLDGSTPIFIGSAIFPNSVHPCRIIPSLNPPCRVLSGGGELEHHGRYDLLPITQDMEWVPTKHGEMPPGRRPVEAGYESSGEKLYHALGLVESVYVPGKAGQHLVSAFNLFTLRRGF